MFIYGKALDKSGICETAPLSGDTLSIIINGKARTKRLYGIRAFSMDTKLGKLGQKLLQEKYTYGSNILFTEIGGRKGIIAIPFKQPISKLTDVAIDLLKSGLAYVYFPERKVKNWLDVKPNPKTEIESKILSTYLKIEEDARSTFTGAWNSLLFDEDPVTPAWLVRKKGK